MRLSLVLIAKDEQEVIGQCLQTVAHLVQEIIVVDTGSTDNTVAIARHFGAQVHHFTWINDFAAARNYAFQQATGDYIFWLDADDVLEPPDQHKLSRLQLGTHDAYLMRYNYSQDEQGVCTCSLYRHRIVRNHRNIVWQYPIHECLIRPHCTESMTDIVVTHRRTAAMIAGDLDRNYKLLQKLIDDGAADQRVRFYYAMELARVGKAQAAVAAFEEYFQGTDWHENMVNGRLYLAYTLLALQQPDAAIESCLQGIKLDPRWAEFYVTIGQIYYDRGDWTQAVRWFELASQRPRPETWGTVMDEHYSWIPWDRLCKCHFELGQDLQANDCNERALQHRVDERLLYNREVLRDRLFPGRILERPIRLNLGAGLRLTPSYRRTDIYAQPGITEVFDQSSIPYHDSTSSALYSSHALEHCTSHYQVAPILAEWTRVLKPRGHLTIRVPDLEACCQQFLTQPARRDWYKYTIYGIQQSNDGEPAECQYHHTGFTIDSLTQAVLQHGFQVTQINRYDGYGTPSLHLEAVQTSKPLRVRWVDYQGNQPIHAYLLAQGLDSQVVLAPDKQHLKRLDIVIYPGAQNHTDTIEFLNRHGVTTLLYIDSNEYCIETAQAATQLVCTSPELVVELSAYNCTTCITGTDGWVPLLEQLARTSCNPPLVDIVIPTWNNLEYLQVTIESIRACTDWPYTITVVNQGDQASHWLDQQTDITHIQTGREHFAAGCNTGVRAGTSPYVMLLNDDVIVSDNWLPALMSEVRKPGVGLVGPYSNCDRGWLHHDDIVVEGVSLVPGMRLPQVTPIIPQIQRYRHPKAVYERDWVAFWAVLLARTTWDAVGPLDEQFLSGCEDVDYCKRLRAQGWDIRQTYDSFIFHFGGVSRHVAEAVDSATNQAQDQANHRKLIAKYGTTEYAPPAVLARASTCRPPRALLYTGPAWEHWGARSVQQGGIGGSETMAVHAARELAARGYEVKLFGDPGPVHAGTYDGVEYIAHTECEQYVRTVPVDLFITSRRPDITSILESVRAQNRDCPIFCWVHDIWLSHDPAANINSALIDKYLVLSSWHRDFFLQHHSQGNNQSELAAKLFITHNVIDLDRFRASPPRVPHSFVYSSSPDRGLDVLLALWPGIRAHLPEATLHVYYGFDNWIKSAQSQRNQQQLDWIARVQQALQQDGITYHGRVGQQELADGFLRASIWAYPTYFTETFCITATEAMAAGLPVITTDLAGLSDTVGAAGILLPGNPNTPEYQRQFLENCLWVLREPEIWSRYSSLGQAKAATYTVQHMIDEWLQLCPNYPSLGLVAR